MTEQLEHRRERCALAVARLSAERGWGLAPGDLARYADAISAIVPPGCDEGYLLRVAGYYHSEHASVAVLRDQRQPAHAEAWERWVRAAVRQIQSSGIAGGDQLLDAEDLAQEALADLVRELPRYRYESRLTHWAYQVISRSALSQLERQLAKRRRGRLEPLDAGLHAERHADPQPTEDLVWSRALARYAAEVLDAASPDRRLARVLLLHAAEERTFREIGAQLGLSHARVKGLYDQATAILRSDRGVRQWHAATRAHYDEGHDER